MAIKMRSSTPIKNYIILTSCICFIFIVFIYRSLRSIKDSSKYYTDYYDNTSLEDLSDGLVKLIQTTCSKIDRIAEHNICSFKQLDEEKNCLIFSVTTSSDLKFETKISKLLKRCKIRVYDHEDKATSDAVVNYKVIKQLNNKKFDEKWLSKILSTEKRKSKIHLLRIEAGDQTDKIIQSKLLKEHSICHLLLTVSGLSKEKIGNFVKKMQKSYGYILYAAYKMVKEKQNDNNEESVAMLKDSLEEDTVNLLENQKEERKINTKDKREKRGSENIRRSPTGVYTMSFISKNCQKEYGVKWIEQ